MLACWVLLYISPPPHLLDNAGRPRLNITCSATFVPSTATYDVEAVWFVDPLAVPAISLFNVTLTDLAVQGFRLNTFGTKEVFTSVSEKTHQYLCKF